VILPLFFFHARYFDARPNAVVSGLRPKIVGLNEACPRRST
jgi:hypothetical protein